MDLDPRFFLHIETSSDGVSSRWHVDFERMRGKLAIESGEGVTIRFNVRRRDSGDWQFAIAGLLGPRQPMSGKIGKLIESKLPSRRSDATDEWEAFEGFQARQLESQYREFVRERAKGEDA